MKPLATSYRTEEVWIPPNDRFVTYEKSDESWCRYFGIGKVETRPVELYDVRYPNGVLLGYTELVPEYGKRVRIPIAEPRKVLMDWTRGSGVPYAVAERLRYTDLEARKFVIPISGTWGRADDYSVCWVAENMGHAQDLIESKYVIPATEDNLHRYVNEVMESCHNRLTPSK